MPKHRLPPPPTSSGNYSDQNPLFDGYEAIPGSVFNPREDNSVWFAKVPLWLTCRSEVNQGAKVLYGLLVALCNPKSGIAEAGQERLRKGLGLKSTRSVRHWVDALEKARLINVERLGMNRPNRYTFLLHEWMEEEL